MYSFYKYIYEYANLICLYCLEIAANEFGVLELQAKQHEYFFSCFLFYNCYIIIFVRAYNKYVHEYFYIENEL